MSTSPETPTPRSIAREAAGLLLVAAGVLSVLVTLGAIHPLLCTAAAAGGTAAAFGCLSPPTSRTSRVAASLVSLVVAAATIGSAFFYYPPLGWLEVGAGITATGVWLASEGS
ncbi:hypothetical protein ACIQU6_34910 [Streptomyces sp. NPDC090442]|uniref:hypothetical protein n=1 Tax=Streptomyces sp. NPDC090442 TaxID=3365962 RepID=UPI0037F31B2A